MTVREAALSKVTAPLRVAIVADAVLKSVDDAVPKTCTIL